MYHSHLCSIQVAFGIEPTEVWSDETLGLKRVKSNGTISFLTDLAFRGLGRYMVYPWYQVSMHVTQKLRYSSQGLSTYMYHLRQTLFHQ